MPIFSNKLPSDCDGGRQILKITQLPHRLISKHKNFTSLSNWKDFSSVDGISLLTYTKRPPLLVSLSSLSLNLDLHLLSLFLRKKLLSIIRSPAISFYGIHDLKGLSYLTQLRVRLSKLNFHKFKHNFRDTINPMCPTSDGMFNFNIFSLELLNYYDRFYKSLTCQMMFWYSFYCMVIKTFPMT